MPADDTPEVRTEIEPLGEAGRLARVTVHNPARLNVVDSDLIRQLITAFRTLGGEHELRCVVLTGSGPRAFIGGADIRELAELSHETTHPFISRLHLACQAIRRLQVPVIARIRGYCLGAGVEIAASCDLRVASDDAIFGMPEVKVGIPSVIEAALLPRLIGAGRARELVYTGEPIAAAEAERWGLVERVVPAAELDAATARWVNAIARRRARRRPAAEGAGPAVGDAAPRPRHPGRHPLVHDRLPHRRAAPAHAGVPRPEAGVAPALRRDRGAGYTSYTLQRNARAEEMVTRVQKWGNSQGLRFSRSVLAEARIDVGDQVRVSVQEGRIIVEPVSRVRGSHDLRALVARMPKDYQVEEADWGPPVGREVW